MTTTTTTAIPVRLDLDALLALIVTINAWNALSVASRAWEPAPSTD